MADDDSAKARNPPPIPSIEDPALNPVRRHHSASGEKDGDDAICSKHVSLDKETTISGSNPVDSKLKSQSEKDLERGETARPQAWYWRYLKHWKQALFIVVWLLFTG